VLIAYIFLLTTPFKDLLFLNIITLRN